MDDKTLFYDLGRNSHICETDAPCCSDVICDDIASDTSQTDLLISIGINNNDDSLKINNSPLINAGVIDIDHNNLIEKQNTLGVYPIKIDKNGHISEYGDALGLVSDEQDGLMPNVNSNTDEGTLGEDDLVFNATLKKYQKLPGSIFDRGVTSITAGTGLTGGTITTTGTIALASSGVTPGTYQGLTIDTYGRVTGAQNMNCGNWVKPTLATNNNTYYLTGIQTTSSTNSTIYNTYISNTNSGVKYVSDTTNGGKMYIDDNEVTVGLFYAIN